MEYSYKEREAINAALQAGRKIASKPERALTEAEFQELEGLATNCPVPVPPTVVHRAAKLRDELARLLQTYLLPSKRAEATRQLNEIELPRAKRANRSRPEELDEFLFSFVRFYVRLGGAPTHSEGTPSPDRTRVPHPAETSGAEEARTVQVDGGLTAGLACRVRAFFLAFLACARRFLRPNSCRFFGSHLCIRLSLWDMLTISPF